MTLRIPFYATLAYLVAAGSAWGQTLEGSSVAIGYQALPSRTPGTVQSGLQLSDSTLLHVGVGVEGGYDTNVFYGETDVRGSAILRVVPFLEFTNASRNGSVGDLFFDAGASLTYREYLSNDALIKDQRAFMPSAFANFEYGRSQTVGLAVTEAFARTEDPPYLQTAGLEPIARDVNQASASVRLAPGGGRLAATARYTNTIDYFETDALKVANSMGNQLLLDGAWKWLPKTALTLQVSQGYIFYFNSDENGDKKPTSFPFRALAGIRGLITAKLTVNVALGYSNGFYDMTRPGPSGFRGNFTATADVTYRPTMLTTIVAGYRRDFQNAILGDFYYLDAFYLNVGQAIAGRLGLGLSARYESRFFQNVPLAMPDTFTNRHDNYIQFAGNLDYHIREWIYAGVSYTLMSNNSDYQPPAIDDPGRVNYLKQLIFARLGATY